MKGFDIMKHKKVIVFALVVTVLSTGGFYAAHASAQSEKSKMEYVSDVTDPDYEKNFTEEQQAFNELVNKQLYKETANNLKEYEQYGLTYDSDKNQMYFNGTPVFYFVDNCANDGTFMGTEIHSVNGDIGIVVERDRSGNITDLKQLSTSELSEFLAKSWNQK